MAMVAASPSQPSPSTRQISTTTSRIGPGRTRPRRRDADQPPSAASASSSSPRRVPQPRSASLEQSDGLTEPEEPEDKLKEALRRSASGRDGPSAATPQRPPRLNPSRSTKSRQTPKQAVIYDVDSPLVETSSSSSLQAATSSPSSASHQAFQERFDRLRARLRQTDAAKASEDGDAALAPRRASSLKSTSTILARLEERRRLQAEERLSASPDDVELQSRDTGAPSSSPSPRRRPRSYHARASSEDLSAEPSSSSSPSPEASPPTSLLRRRNTYTDASPPARSPLGVARRVSNSARPAIDEAEGDKKKTSESSPPMLQMPESLRSQRDTSTAAAAPPSRRHVQRLLNSERGADNAGNSPRKQPTSNVTIMRGGSGKSEAQGTTTTPAVASPSFLERARAARALQASQAEAAAAAKRRQRAEEVERGDRESSDNGSDQRRPLATLRKKPSLLQQQLVASPSSPPTAVSREDEEDEAAVELQLTPESSPTPARRKTTAEASPSSPSPASSRSLSSSPLPRSSSRQPDARRVRAALLAAKGEYSPRRAEATAVDDVPETPVRRSFAAAAAAAAAAAKPVSSSRLAPQLDKISTEEGAVNDVHAKRSTTPTMAPPASNAPRRFLKGVAVLVDVRDADGRDLSYQYVDLLRSHGAKVASRCPSADSRRQLTHIVWRQGKPSTLRYLKGLLEEGADDASVAVVSVDWVTRCVEAGRRVTEEDHLVEVGRQAARHAQDHREKQRQKRRSSMLPSRGSADQIQSLLSTASSSKSLGLGLDVVTRLAAKHCPEVGSPLRWEIQLQEYSEGGEERRES